MIKLTKRRFVPTKSLFENIKILFLFIGFLYAFIPFETSSYLISNGIHILFLICIMLYALYVGSFKIRMNLLGRLSLILIFLFVAVSSMISYGKSEVIFVFSIIFSFVTASIIHYVPRFRNQFLLALKWLIVFSIFMLFLQLAVLTITGEVLHLHEIIYPFSEARISVNFKFDELTRMGGIYIEPGTYSNTMYLFLVIYIVLSKNISSPLLYIGAISMILSYAVWGMIFGSYLLIILGFLKLKRNSWMMKILFFTIVLLVGNFTINKVLDSPAIQYATYKMESGNASVTDKEEVYQKYQENLGDFLIFGEGFSPEFAIGMRSFQDSGLLLNISVVFGIAFTLFILIIYVSSFLKCCGWVIFLISLPIFLSKIFYWDASFWLLFFIVVYGGYSRHKKLKQVEE